MLGTIIAWVRNLTIVGGVVLGATTTIGVVSTATQPHQPAAPASTSAPVKSQVKPAKKTVITHKTVTETNLIPFETKTIETLTLNKGETKVIAEGTNGEKTLTYDLAFTNGVQTNKTLVNVAVIKQPVTKTILAGTYIAPKASIPTPSYYTNTDGNQVRSPSSDPVGATAKCSDGTYSYSQNRRGTRSHHGGVAAWL